MKKIVITIGRENGSGGRYIGELLAKKLGIKCYNDELLEETAKKYNIDLSYLKKTDEKKPNNLMYSVLCNYILSDLENVINIFVYAPLGARIERYARRNNVDVIKAEKMITREDKQRANYYNFYTSQIWGEAKGYNLSIDTSKTGIEGAVKLIEDYINIVNSNDDNKIK